VTIRKQLFSGTWRRAVWCICTNVLQKRAVCSALHPRYFNVNQHSIAAQENTSFFCTVSHKACRM